MRPDRNIRCICFVLALLPLLLVGCGGSDSVAPATVTRVTITPTTATLPVGGSQSFTANVTGLTNKAVTWSVQEGTPGGSITADGIYTAPATPGTFHVIATSQGDATKQVSAAVTVQAGNVQGTIQ